MSVKGGVRVRGEGGDPCEGFESHVVALDGLDMAVAREPPVAIHDKGDVLRDFVLAERVDEELFSLGDGPFDRRRGEKPPTGSGGAVECRGHCGRPWGGLRGGGVRASKSSQWLQKDMCRLNVTGRRSPGTRIQSTSCTKQPISDNRNNSSGRATSHRIPELRGWRTNSSCK